MSCQGAVICGVVLSKGKNTKQKIVAPLFGSTFAKLRGKLFIRHNLETMKRKILKNVFTRSTRLSNLFSGKKVKKIKIKYLEFPVEDAFEKENNR